MRALASLQSGCLAGQTTRHAVRCPAHGTAHRRTVVVSAAAQYDTYDAPQQQGQGGRGRGRGGYRGGTGYGNNPNYARGPVSYEEDGDMGDRPQRGYNRGGYGRGGGRGGGRGEQQERRAISPEAQAINDAIQDAQGWRNLQTILEQNSRAGMRGLDGFQLVALLLRLTKMPLPKEGDDAADFQQFVASVYGWMMDRIPRFRSRQIASAILCVGKLNLYNAELVGALLERAQTQMFEFGASEYVRFLSGLVRLNMAPPEEWTTEFFKTSAEQIIRSAKQDDITTILSICGRLGMRPTPEWLSIVTQAALERVATRDMMRLSEYRRLLVGLASLGWRPDQQQLQMLVEKSYPLLNSPVVQVQDLNEIAWSLAQWETPMPPQWAKVFTDRMMRCRRFFRPSDLGSVLYSLAYLRAPPREDQLESLLQDVKNQFIDCTGDDLANIAMALVQFQYTPKDAYMDDFLIAMKGKLATCTATGLQNIMSALPAMGTGVRLNEVVREAVSRYDALMAMQNVGGEAAVEAADQQQYEAQQAEAQQAEAQQYEAAVAAEQQPVA